MAAAFRTAFEHRVRDYPAVLLLPLPIGATSDAALLSIHHGARTLVDGEGFEPS